MTTKDATSADVRDLPDHVLALSIIRAQLLIAGGNKGSERRLEILEKERARRNRHAA